MPGCWLNAIKQNAKSKPKCACRSPLYWSGTSTTGKGASHLLSLLVLRWSFILKDYFCSLQTLQTDTNRQNYTNGEIIKSEVKEGSLTERTSKEQIPIRYVYSHLLAGLREGHARERRGKRLCVHLAARALQVVVLPGLSVGRLKTHSKTARHRISSLESLVARGGRGWQHWRKRVRQQAFLCFAKFF